MDWNLKRYIQLVTSMSVENIKSKNGSEYSSLRVHVFGVSQGSLLGYVLFNLSLPDPERGEKT